MHQNFTEANESHFSQNIGVLHSEKRASCNKSVDILRQLVTTSRPVKSKSRYYKERNVQSKKRKAIRR